MSIFSYFKKQEAPELGSKVIQAQEVKSYQPHSGLSFVDYLMGNGQYDLAMFVCIVMYKKCMPLFHAINMRAEAVGQIPIRVQDKNTKEFIDDHPVLELLEQPNADVSQMEFMEQLSSFFDITGNAFIYGSGRLEAPPLELACLSPQFATFGTVSERFGLLNIPRDISYTNSSGGIVSFFADETQSLGLRFKNKDETGELWHLRSFNPTRDGGTFTGMSKIQPIFMEIQQYISGNTTNLSNLKRGTRLSMAWVNSTGTQLTDIQYQRAIEASEKYAGDHNSGQTPVLDGFDVKSIQQTNREMEYNELHEATLSRISSIYDIPLALMISESMTLDNLKTSMLQFFDAGVLPLAGRLYSEMTRMLMPRYKGSENLILTYNESDIPALKTRLLENAERISKIDVHTPNEIRAKIGDGPLDKGGDDVYRSSTLIPIGEDFLDDEDEDEKELTTNDF